MVLRRKIATEQYVLFSQDQIYKSSLPFLFHFRAETSPHSHSLLTSLKAVLFLTMGLYPDALFCITSASLHLTTRSVYKNPEVLDPVFLSNMDCEQCCPYSDMSRASHGGLSNLPRATSLRKYDSSSPHSHQLCFHQRWRLMGLSPIPAGMSTGQILLRFCLVQVLQATIADVSYNICIKSRSHCFLLNLWALESFCTLIHIF